MPLRQKENSRQLTSDELSEIRTFQDQMNKLIYGFGQLKQKKLRVSAEWDALLVEEKQLEESYFELLKIEKTLASGITSKYGDGKVDLETGIIE